MTWRAGIAAAALTALFPCAGARAEDGARRAADEWRWFVEAGRASDAVAARAGASLDWPAHWRIGGAILTGYTEASLGAWKATRPAADSRSSFAHVAVTPVLRLWLVDRQGWFAEGGIGAGVIAPKFTTRERRFSTTFNFGDHVGVGWRSAAPAAWEIALRYEHFSNGSIKRPNPGDEFLQLRVGAAFY